MPARIKNRLWVCLCATLLLVGIDIGFFGFSYAMPFVDAIDFVRLALLALCVAWFCTPVLTLATLGFEAITTLGPFKRATRYVPVVFSITLALFLVAVVNQSAGKVFAFAPWWQSVAALIVAALYFGLFRIVEKKWPAASVVIACFSALAVALFLVTYLPLYLQGGFGFTGHSQTVMRTAMTAAIVIAGLGLPIVYAVWDQLWSRLPAIALTIAAVLTLLVAHVVNITLYVDNYPEIHSFIALFSIGLCVDLFLRRLGDAPRRTFVAVAVLFHVGLFGIVTSRGTNPGYVGAVHTGWIRYGLHLFHHEIGNAPRNARNFVVKNRYRI